MNFDSLYRNGVNRIWSEDRESQKQYTDIVAKARNMTAFDFQAIHSIFVPNDTYLLQYFDSEIKDDMYGFYDHSDICYWNNCLLLPIFNVSDKIVSVVGFNPFNYVKAKETKDWSINYYVYASSTYVRKGAFLFYLEGCYKRALQDKYLFITDGVFDTVSLQLAGFNAAALNGSKITPEINAMLQFIDKILLVVDNDEAGYKLAKELRMIHKGVIVIKQQHTKDIDELLKGSKRKATIIELQKALKCSLDVYNLAV